MISGFYRDVAGWDDKLSDKPPRRRREVSALKIVFSWGSAIRKIKIKANPFANMERVYPADQSDII